MQLIAMTQWSFVVHPPPDRNFPLNSCQVSAHFGNRGLCHRLSRGSTIFRTRKAYVKVYQSAHTDIAVKNLTAILLADFDSRFRPADEDVKVTYTGKTNVGFRNRYIAPHPFLFLAYFSEYPESKVFFMATKKIFHTSCCLTNMRILKGMW